MSLDELKQQRTSTKKNITRIKNIIDASLRPGGKVLSVAEYKCRLGILESYFKQILSIQTDIERLDSEDGGRADLEELYVTTKLVIQSQLAEDNNVSFSDTTCVVQSSSKLPPLKLPTFDGKYSNYQNFITSFKQIIDHEFNLTNIEKFNHLRNCLQGQALETVNAFQVTNENYPKALERLKVRYDNKPLIFLEGINSLFDLPAVMKPNGIQLRSLIDKASAIYGSLTSLGNDRQISQAMLIYLILQKSDEQTNKRWKESLDFRTLPSWEDFIAVLERHCQYLESLDNPHGSTSPAQGFNKHSTPKSCSTISCQFCFNNNHKIFNCERFKSLNITQRFDHAKKIGLCINCLSKGHQVANCSSSHRCKVCARQHHSLLHRGSPSGQPTTTQLFPTQEAAVHTHMNNSSLDNVILATAKIFVRDSTGSYRLGTALLDSCSQANFITDNFSQRLLLPRNKQNIEIQSIGSSSTNIKFKTSTNFKSQVTGFELPLTFCITSHIAYQPDPEINISTWNIPKNIVLADDEFNIPKKIDMLLGTETFFSLLSVDQIHLGSNLPILQKTLLGWIVSGRYNTGSNNISKPSCLFLANESLDAKLEKLWKLEEVTTIPEPWTREQQICDNLYNTTVARRPCGRIVVKLPFKDDPTCLGESYTTALRRFNAQERRLAKSPQLTEQYVEFMNDYESLGHMSIVRNPNLSEPHYFIPHHCVLKPTSTTTRLRVVFDASCRTTSQKSLNDIQMVGPTIQCELFMLFLRFRFNRFALTADIVKMYRQILMHEDDRKFQYILWRSSPTEKIRTYQLNTVTYGMAAAPYLAIRSLLYLAEQHSKQFPIGAKIVKSSFYVDDLLCGADSLTELSQIRQEVTQL
ncbi:uncharacterized protein LOC125779686 [Bactrocera dorsalis]|uniref:Uncharacterized protein LOC125779686 n=1 Tax=Bactrocera dorsalis TaxID=27457 RepID=A0ABM3K614_BACDO|nr:uncharacterized protein LOC125779686 [Bactrocera dorsalis]